MAGSGATAIPYGSPFIPRFDLSHHARAATGAPGTPGFKGFGACRSEGAHGRFSLINQAFSPMSAGNGRFLKEIRVNA